VKPNHVSEGLTGSSGKLAALAFLPDGLQDVDHDIGGRQRFTDLPKRVKFAGL